MTDADYINTLVSICKDMQTNFTIRFSTKRYTSNLENCTVLMFGQTFKAIGEESIYVAIRSCVEYAVENLKAYENLKPALEEARLKRNMYCTRVSYPQITSFKYNYNENT